MSLDDRVRRALGDEAESVEPRRPRLEHVERGARKRRVQRGFVAAIGTAGLVAGAIVMVSNIDVTDRDRPEPVASPTASPSPTPEYAVLPQRALGRYSLTLEPGGRVSRLTAAGKWNLTLSADGSYEAVGPEDFFYAPLAGIYKVEGNEITLGPSSHCDAESIYEWSLTGSDLVFVPIREECPHRRVVLSTKAWLKK